MCRIRNFVFLYFIHCFYFTQGSVGLFVLCICFYVVSVRLCVFLLQCRNPALELPLASLRGWGGGGWGKWGHLPPVILGFG